MENKITKEKFRRYLEVQRSGYTNMFDVKTVIELSDDILTKEDCLDIMDNYKKYEKKFNLTTETLESLDN